MEECARSTWNLVCLCASSILSSNSLHGREFLGLWSRRPGIVDDEIRPYPRRWTKGQKQAPLNFFPSSPFFPRLGIIFIKKSSRANLLAKKKKKRYTTLKKRRKEEVLSTVPRSPPLQLCTWPGRDREHVPLSPPVLEIIPRKQYHFSMYRFSPLDWKETPMFAIASLNLDDFQVERKSGLTKFWRR